MVGFEEEHSHAIPLRTPLGRSGERSDFFGMPVTPDLDRRNADAKRAQWKYRRAPAAILAFQHATLHVPFVEQLQCRGVELSYHAIASDGPVIALEQHHENITADVSQEIEVRLDMPQQRVGHQLDHAIAAEIAVLVVEGLEVVEVAARSPE